MEWLTLSLIFWLSLSALLWCLQCDQISKPESAQFPVLIKMVYLGVQSFWHKKSILFFRASVQLLFFEDIKIISQHSVWKSQIKSQSVSVNSKRSESSKKYVQWVDKIVFENGSLWSNSVTRQVIFYRKKFGGKRQNKRYSNASFWYFSNNVHLAISLRTVYICNKTNEYPWNNHNNTDETKKYQFGSNSFAVTLSFTFAIQFKKVVINEEGST